MLNPEQNKSLNEALDSHEKKQEEQEYSPEQKRDLHYMSLALEEAKQAFEEDEVPVGAIIVCQDRIIARAHNLTQTLVDVTAHAEMQAFTSASSFLGGKYLRDCTLYVSLEPCIMCAGASYWCQIGRIVYGASDPKKGFTQYKGQILHPKTKICSGILAGESQELMTAFFKNKR